MQSEYQEELIEVTQPYVDKWFDNPSIVISSFALMLVFVILLVWILLNKYMASIERRIDNLCRCQDNVTEKLNTCQNVIGEIKVILQSQEETITSQNRVIEQALMRALNGKGNGQVKNDNS
jgi:predicted PurR-regulated permease PerM